jgi:predicted dienelactone hydrolase
MNCFTHQLSALSPPAGSMEPISAVREYLGTAKSGRASVPRIAVTRAYFTNVMGPYYHHSSRQTREVGELRDQTEQLDSGGASRAGEYDPFIQGRFPVGVRTIDALDTARHRLFPCEIWYPAAARHTGQDLAPGSRDFFAVPSRDAPRSQMAIRDAATCPGTYPLIVFSHPSVTHRRAATFLCTHLGSHGYVVAALDHSEVVAPELARKDGETDEQRRARVEAMIAARPPDIRFALDYLLSNAVLGADAVLDAGQIGIVGHSFGGWTALAAMDIERRIRAVVALAPGGGSRPKPGIPPLNLAFKWGRDIPTLFLVAENDISLPLAGMHEIIGRTPATKYMVIFRRADHYHSMDDVEEVHEAVRTTPWGGELEWFKEMRPIEGLCSGEQAHLFVRGLTLCHLDATLRREERAQRFTRGNVDAELAARSVDVIVHDRQHRQHQSPGAV